MSTLTQADPWRVAADLLDPPADGVGQYRNDPARFVVECFNWAPDKGPTSYQLDVLERVPVQGRVCVRGPHGLGKTTEAAWAILWFALTRDAFQEDWKVPTTASVWRQLEKFLWPEVHKWARMLKWDVLGRRPFNQEELLRMSIKLHTGEAFAVASDDPARIEGAHADQVLYVYDEAKTIPPETFDASEGAFSGAGTDTAAEAYALASSTPGEPVGRFYDIQKRKPGTEDWDVVHVTLEDTVRAGRVSSEWAAQRKLQWGEQSAVYQNRVLGEFASSEEDTVIPLAWVEAANERWEERPPAGPLDAVGVDVARSGEDKTVLALRYGLAIEELRRYSRQGTMDTTGRVAAVLRDTDHAYAVVDVIGIGAGVFDRLCELGCRTEPFNASERSVRLDSSGELGFVNKRSAAWWNLRELLDPDRPGEGLALPPDDLLVGDLTSPHWRVMSGGRVQVESKDDIFKRLGRSTDDGDAVVMAYWPGEPQEQVQVREYYEPVTIGATI